VALVAGITAGEALSYIFLFLLYAFFSGREKDGIPLGEKPLATAKSIASVTLPIAMSAYIVNILHTAESVLIPLQFVRYGGDRDRALSDFGVIRGMTIPMLFFPFAFLGALLSIQIPAISRANTSPDKTERNRLIRRVMRISTVIAAATGVLFLLFPSQISQLIYKTDECARSTRLLALVTPFMYIETMSDGILKSIGEQKRTLLYGTVVSVLRVVAVLVLIPLTGAEGYLWLLIGSNTLSFGLCYGRLKKVTRDEG